MLLDFVVAVNSLRVAEVGTGAWEAAATLLIDYLSCLTGQ